MRLLPRLPVRLLPVFLGGLLLAGPAAAQSLNISLGSGPSFTGQLVRMVLLITVLSLAPSLLVMVTAFTRIIIVLSFLRTAIGLQQTPPNPVLIGLALFLTAFIMAPTFQTAWDDGLQPLMADEIDQEEGLARTVAPFKTFMLHQVREDDLRLFIDIVHAPRPETPEAVPLRLLLPGFMLSELRRAFEIGFVIFVPFLIIDMVVASILMSMGMMMLPPVMISLPFKIIFFVLIDGWALIVGSLMRSFGPL